MKSRKNNFVNKTKVATFYIFSNFYNKFIVFISIPIFTRLMSTEDFGIFNTYISWVTIFSVLIGLSLGSSIRAAKVDHEKDLDSFVSTITIMGMINFTVVSTILLVLFNIFPVVDNVLLVMCLIHSFSIFIINNLNVYFMMTEKHIKKNILLILPITIVTILSITGLLLIKDNGYLVRIFSFVITYLIVCIILLIYVFKRSEKVFDIKYIKYALIFSVPLMFHGVSLTILNSIDRSVITVFMGSSSTGIYSLIYNLAIIVSIVHLSLENIWIPWFTKELKLDRYQNINNYSILYVDLVLFFSIILLFFSPEILLLMAPFEYYSGIIYLPPVLTGSFVVFLYSMLVHIEYYYKKTKMIAISTVIAAGINLISNVIFIPYYGLWAASISTLVSYLFLFLFHKRVAKKLNKNLFNTFFFVKSLIILIIFSIIFYVIIDMIIIRSIVVLLTIIFFYRKHMIKNREQFFQLIKKKNLKSNE